MPREMTKERAVISPINKLGDMADKVNTRKPLARMVVVVPKAVPTR